MSPVSAPRYESAVCAIARDETRYILQWVAYHLAIGFEHIYIYDNMSVRPIVDMLSDQMLRRRVTVTRWPSIAGENAQLTAYRHFLHTYRNDVEWGAVIDLDEYINLKKHAGISDFLRQFPSATSIAINWRIFGSSNEINYQKIMLMDRFKRASELEFHPNILVKTIHKMSKVGIIDIHHGHYDQSAIAVTPSGYLMDGGYHLVQNQKNFDIAQINHYFVKSTAEWKLKIRRGYTDDTVRPPDMFDAYDRNEVLDTTILRYGPATRNMMRRVRRPTNVIGSLTALLPGTAPR